jgi:glycosyltransferase involved in cell wall biosynthesis
MLISVALPIYNGNPLLSEALSSILAQDVDLEVVVSDDGSSDGSVETVEAFCDKRVRVIRNLSNAGIFGNLNRAIRAARGDLIQVFSQDDVMLPGYLASQSAMLDKHTHGGLVYGAVRAIDADGSSSSFDEFDSTPEVINSELYVWIASHFGALSSSISSIMIPKKTFDTIGLFDESYRVAGDVEFYNRVSERFVILRNAEVKHCVRSHPRMATVHSTSGPLYLTEEIRLEPWFRKHWSDSDWRKVRRFRSAGRGRYHLGWIRRRLASGRLTEAARGLWATNRLYPMHEVLGSIMQRSIHAEIKLIPLIAPPSP